MTTKGRTHWCEPNMALPAPSTTQTDNMAWERRTLVDRVASLSNTRDHVPGDVPEPDKNQLAFSTHMTLM